MNCTVECSTLVKFSVSKESRENDWDNIQFKHWTTDHIYTLWFFMCSFVWLVEYNVWMSFVFCHNHSTHIWCLDNVWYARTIYHNRRTIRMADNSISKILIRAEYRASSTENKWKMSEIRTKTNILLVVYRKMNLRKSFHNTEWRQTAWRKFTLELFLVWKQSVLCIV